VAAFPRLAQAGRKIAALEGAFHAASRAMQMLVLPMGIAAFMALPTALHLWLGDKSLADKIAPVTMLLVLHLPGALCQIPYQVTLARVLDVRSLSRSGGSTAGTPIDIFSIKHLGLVGSAVIYAFVNLGMVAFSNPIVIRLYFPSHWIRNTIYHSLCPPASSIVALALSLQVSDISRQFALVAGRRSGRSPALRLDAGIALPEHWHRPTESAKSSRRTAG
jgi:hypothetical protein